MFYEYNIISRNYMLGVLFLFLAMSFYAKRNEKRLIFTLFLILASNIHLIFLIISVAFYVFVIFENSKKLFTYKNNIAHIIFSIGIILAIVQIIPPQDTIFFENIQNLTFFNRLKIGFISVWKGIITLPNFSTINFWNTNFLMKFSMSTVVFFGLVIYLFPLLIFNKNIKVLLFVYGSLFGAQAFFFITQRGNARSEGMIYLIFIIALWLNQCNESTKFSIDKVRSKNLKSIFIYCVLIIHFFSGIFAYSMDIKHTFSPAKNIAKYIKNSYLNEYTIITTYCNEPLSSYLQKDLFTLCTNNFDSFCHWNMNCDASEVETVNVVSFLKKQNKSSIFITLDSVAIENQNIEMNLLKKYPKSIIKNRKYHIFEIRYKNDK